MHVFGLDMRGGLDLRHSHKRENIMLRFLFFLITFALTAEAFANPVAFINRWRIGPLSTVTNKPICGGGNASYTHTEDIYPLSPEGLPMGDGQPDKVIEWVQIAPQTNVQDPDLPLPEVTAINDLFSSARVDFSQFQNIPWQDHTVGTSACWLKFGDFDNGEVGSFIVRAWMKTINSQANCPGLDLPCYKPQVDYIEIVEIENQWDLTFRWQTNPVAICLTGGCPVTVAWAYVEGPAVMSIDGINVANNTITFSGIPNEDMYTINVIDLSVGVFEAIYSGYIGHKAMSVFINSRTVDVDFTGVSGPHGIQVCSVHQPAKCAYAEFDI